MTREQKLALIVGFALVLVVGVLISDQLSVSRRSMDATDGGLAMSLEPTTTQIQPGLGRQLEHMPPQTANRFPPAEETRVVFADPFPMDPVADEQAVPEGATLADIAKRGLEDIGSLMREAQDNGIPAYHPVEVTTMGEPVASTAQRESASKLTIPLITPIDEPKPKETVRPVRTHRVQEGDTLWSIAKKYYGDGEAATELAKYNEKRVGKGGMIREGASLLIPDRDELGLAGDTRVSASTPKADTKPAKSESKTAQADTKKTDNKPATKGDAPRTYTVKSGDTLQKISDKHFGTTRRWMEIVAMNKDVIDDEDNVRVGTVLKIPAR